ncbi:hypothetical protein [Methylocystis echinoides]|uniref:hypothetical protein n=1 Tax=Methylocystis echinoides TaxID=29468 RepID=UPI002490755B|nr:hypothetical protein [Methylocystis echinoides]
MINKHRLATGLFSSALAALPPVGSTCGAPTLSAVQRIVVFQSSAYTDGKRSTLLKAADLTITNPPAPAQSGMVASQ